MKIQISFNKKESNELKHNLCEGLRKVENYEDANEVNKALDLYEDSKEVRHFTGCVATATIKDGAMSMKFDFNENFVCSTFAYCVKVVEKLYPIYTSIKGLAFTVKNLIKGLDDEYNAMVNPFKPKTTAGYIKVYRNDDLRVYATFIELVNEFGESHKNCYHCLHNESGISSTEVYKLIKAPVAEKFTMVLAEIKDQNMLADKEFLRHEQEKFDKRIYKDLENAKRGTTEETDEDEEN